MKTIKVSEATNTQLDWLVAKCEGASEHLLLVEYVTLHRKGLLNRFSTSWSAMGPIIERERISVRYWDNSPLVHAYGPGDIGSEWAEGGTGLEAAARCYVMSKLGEEVEVPEELA